MRLIDADYITKGRVSNDPVVIAAKCATTIPAIPVEWVRSKITGAKKDAGAVIHDGVLKELLFDWQKEQEAQDEISLLDTLKEKRALKT